MVFLSPGGTWVCGMNFAKRPGRALWAAMLAAALAAAVGSAAWATPDWDPRNVSLSGKHIEFHITYRDFSKIDRLYHQSLLENLDAFADSLKQAGKLSRGKIHFHILKETWNQSIPAGVEMYSYKGGYYCMLNTYYTAKLTPVSQDYLARIIAYFASDDWESFCSGIYDDEKASLAALRAFNRRIKPMKVSPQYPARKVLELKGGLAVYFQDEALVGKVGDQEYGEIKWLLPFTAGSKSFMTVGETIYVAENGTVINKIKLTEEDFGGWDGAAPRAEVFPKWVNFENSEGCFLSYSIKENKFYKVRGVPDQ